MRQLTFYSEKNIETVVELRDADKSLSPSAAIDTFHGAIRLSYGLLFCGRTLGVREATRTATYPSMYTVISYYRRMLPAAGSARAQLYVRPLRRDLDATSALR